MPVVEVKNLIKNYNSVKAVRDFSFTIDRGELVALVGPDGAGKTSIFRSLCNLINYDAGEINIADYELQRDYEKIKPLIGYMPQIFSLYPDLTVEENIEFYAGLFGLSKDQVKRKEEELYRFSGLGPFHKRRASNLSGGMKQKLALSCNLVHDPEILFLDEPTTGVDPLSRRQFWEILKNLRKAGSTILVSTPYMDEVELADRSIFIYQGSKLAEGTPAELVTKFEGQVFRLDIYPDSETMDGLNAIDGVIARRFGSSIHVYIGNDNKIENFYNDFERLSIGQDKISTIPPDLEDTFIQLMGK